MKMVVTHGIEGWSALPSGAAQRRWRGLEVGPVPGPDLSMRSVLFDYLIGAGEHRFGIG